MALNAEWHRAHVLGSGAPMDARIAWHREHATACGCRPIPASVQRAMEERAVERPGTPGMWLTIRLREPGPMTGWLESIGFTRLAEFRDDEGTLVHGEYLWPNGGGVMVAADRDSGDWPQSPGTSGAYLVVDDVDLTFAAAVDAGAVPLRPPTDEDYGGRGATVRDPEGNLWSFGAYRPGRD